MGAEFGHFTFADDVTWMIRAISVKEVVKSEVEAPTGRNCCTTMPAGYFWGVIPTLLTGSPDQRLYEFHTCSVGK